MDLIFLSEMGNSLVVGFTEEDPRTLDPLRLSYCRRNLPRLAKEYGYRGPTTRDAGHVHELSGISVSHTQYQQKEGSPFGPDVRSFHAKS